MTHHSNAKSKAPQGEPSGSQRVGNGLKDVVHDDSVTSELENKYVNDEGQPDDDQPDPNTIKKNPDSEPGVPDQDF